MFHQEGDVLLVVEGVLIALFADHLDRIFGGDAGADQDECSDEARAVEAGLASDENAIAGLPSVEAEVDCFAKAVEIDLLDRCIGNSVAELLDAPVGRACPGIHGDDRFEGKVLALGVGVLGEVDDIEVISSAHEEVWLDL